MKKPPILGLLFGLCVMLIGAIASCVTLPNGQKALAPQVETAFLNGELALCDTLLPVGVAAAASAAGGPVGAAVGTAATPLSDFACAGSEAAMKAGLDKVTAQADAGVGTASAAMSVADAGASAPKVPLIKTSKGYAVFAGHRQIGCVHSAAQAAAFHTPEVQAVVLPQVTPSASASASAAPSASVSAPPPPPASSASPSTPSVAPLPSPAPAPAGSSLPPPAASAAPSASASASPAVKPSAFARVRSWLHRGAR